MQSLPCRQGSFDGDPGHPDAYPPWAEQPEFQQGRQLQYQNGDRYKVQPLKLTPDMTVLATPIPFVPSVRMLPAEGNPLEPTLGTDDLVLSHEGHTSQDKAQCALQHKIPHLEPKKSMHKTLAWATPILQPAQNPM